MVATHIPLEKILKTDFHKIFSSSKLSNIDDDMNIYEWGIMFKFISSMDISTYVPVSVIFVRVENYW